MNQPNFENDASAPVREWLMVEDSPLDEAIDCAARVCRATVGEFVAALAPADGGARGPLELAVEFLVPPEDQAAFVAEVDRAIVRRSMRYSVERRVHQCPPLRVVELPPGTFHQWRVVWSISHQRHHALRWAGDRHLFESLVLQGRFGWRETAGVG